MRPWQEQIDNNTQHFIESFSGLSTEQLNWKPSPNTWSIAQNIDHLIIINETYFPVIDAIRNGTYKSSFLANFGFMVSFFGNTVLKSVQPDRQKKMKTFPIWEPTTSEIPAGILARFENHQSALKKLIENAQDLLDKGVVISSPANKLIVYKLDKAFEIIITHEQRHYEQAKEVDKLLKLGTHS